MQTVLVVLLSYQEPRSLFFCVFISKVLSLLPCSELHMPTCRTGNMTTGKNTAYLTRHNLEVVRSFPSHSPLDQIVTWGLGNVVFHFGQPVQPTHPPPAPATNLVDFLMEKKRMASSLCHGWVVFDNIQT